MKRACMTNNQSQHDNFAFRAFHSNNAINSADVRMESALCVAALPLPLCICPVIIGIGGAESAGRY